MTQISPSAAQGLIRPQSGEESALVPQAHNHTSLNLSGASMRKKHTDRPVKDDLVLQVNPLILHKALELPSKVKENVALRFSTNKELELPDNLWKMIDGEKSRLTASQHAELKHKNTRQLDTIQATSRDGKLAAASSCHFDLFNNITIDNGKNKKHVQVNMLPSDQERKIVALTFTNDNLLCAKDAQNNVHVFYNNTEDHLTLHSLPEDINIISGSNSHILLCGESKARLHHIYTEASIDFTAPQDFKISSAQVFAGGLIALGSEAGNIALYERQSDDSKPRCIGEIPAKSAQSGKIVHLDFCEKTNRLRCASQSGRLEVFDLQSLKPHEKIKNDPLNTSTASKSSQASQLFYGCLAKLVSFKADEVNSLGLRPGLQQFIGFLQPNESILVVDFLKRFDELTNPNTIDKKTASKKFEVALNHLSQNFNASRALIKSMLNFDFIYHNHTKLNFNEVHDLLNLLTPQENNFNAAANAANQHVKGLFNIAGQGNSIAARFLTGNREGLISDAGSTAQNLQTANGAPATAINQNGLAQGREHNTRLRAELRVPQAELITRSFVADPVVALNNEGIEHTLSIMAAHWENTLKLGSFSHQRMEQLDPIDALRRQLPATILALASNRGAHQVDNTLVSDYVNQLQRFTFNPDTNCIATTQEMIQNIKQKLVPVLCAGLGDRSQALTAWLDGIKNSLLPFTKQSNEVGLLLDAHKTGIAAGHKILNDLPYIKTPSSAAFQAYLKGSSSQLGDLTETDSQLFLSSALNKLTKQDQQMYHELKKQAKTSPAIALSKVLGHRVSMLEKLMRREINRGFIDQQMLLQSVGESIAKESKLHVGSTCIVKRKDRDGLAAVQRMQIESIEHDQGKKYINLVSPHGQANNTKEKVRLGHPAQSLFLDKNIEKDIVAAQKLFMNLEVQFGDRFNLNSFIDQNNLRESLLNLSAVAQLQSINLDYAKLSECADAKRCAALNPNATPRSGIILGGGPTGLLTALLASQQYLAANGTLTLYELRDVDNPDKEPYERSQIVRLDPRWIATLRYVTGTSFEDIFMPLEGHTQAFLANNIPDQGFVETTIKTLEKSLLRTVQEYQKAGHINLDCGKRAEYDHEQNTLKLGNSQKLKLENTDVIDCAGKGKSPNGLFQVTNSEHYAVCCFSGAKVSVIAHKQGDTRYRSPLALAARTTLGDDPTRLIGDFTKAVKVTELFKAIEEAANTKSVQHAFLSILTGSQSKDEKDQFLKTIVTGITNLKKESANFNRDYNQARVFEDGAVYYIGTEVNREFKNWQTSTADEFFPGQADYGKTERAAFNKICDRLWFSGFQTTLNNSNILNPSAKLPVFYPFSNPDETSLEDLALGDAFTLDDKRYEFIEKMATSKNRYMCRDMLGNIDCLSGDKQVRQANDIARSRDGETESNVGVASFPVQHQIAYSALNTDDDHRNFYAKLGDAQASPHFMRYSGLTGGCINAHAIAGVVPRLRQDSPAARVTAANNYRQHIDWSNWEVVVRGTAAGTGDGFLHPSISYRDLIDYAANKIVKEIPNIDAIDEKSRNTALKKLFPNFWIKTFADALIPRAIESNEDFKNGYKASFQNAIDSSDFIHKHELVSPALKDLCKVLGKDIWMEAFVAGDRGKRVPTPLNTQPTALDAHALISGFQGQTAIEATTTAGAAIASLNAAKGIAEDQLGSHAGLVGDSLVPVLGLFTLQRAFSSVANAQQYKRALEAIQANYALTHGPQAMRKLHQLTGSAAALNTHNPLFCDIDQAFDHLQSTARFYDCDPAITSGVDNTLSKAQVETGFQSLDNLLELQTQLANVIIPQSLNGQPYVQASAVNLERTISKFTQTISKSGPSLSEDGLKEARIALEGFDKWQQIARKFIKNSEVKLGVYSNRTWSDSSLFSTMHSIVKATLEPLVNTLAMDKQLAIYEHCSFSLFSAALLKQLSAVQVHAEQTPNTIDLSADIHLLSQFVKARFEADVASATTVAASLTVPASALSFASAMAQLAMAMSDVVMPLSMAAGGVALAPAAITTILNARTLKYDLANILQPRQDMRGSDLTGEQKEAVQTVERLLKQRAAAAALRTGASALAVAAGATSLAGVTVPVSAGLGGASLVSALLASCVDLHAKYGVLYKADQAMLINLCDAYRPWLNEQHAKFLESLPSIDPNRDTIAWKAVAAQFLDTTRYHRATGNDANRTQMINTYISSGLNRAAVLATTSPMTLNDQGKIKLSALIPVDLNNLVPYRLYKVRVEEKDTDLQFKENDKETLKFVSPKDFKEYKFSKKNVLAYGYDTERSSTLVKNSTTKKAFLLMEAKNSKLNVNISLNQMSF